MESAPGTERSGDGPDPRVRRGAETPAPSSPPAPREPASARVSLLVSDHLGSGWERRVPQLAEHGFEARISRSLRETIEILGQEPRPDLLLVDPLSKGGTVELAALESRRQAEGENATPIPVLLVVEREGEEPMLRAHQALRSGHWDLIRRDAGERELELRARRLLGQAEALGEMQALRHRAFHDDRTDLLRPLAFEARLQEHFSAAQRHGHDLALVMIDLDRFGRVNKEFDHTIGDAIIAAVGEAIRGALRTEDVAGRLGGDEFAVLLPYTRKLDASLVVNRLREQIKLVSGRPGGAKGHVDVSASLGFETFDGHDLDSLVQLRRHAERALRVSKLDGGDRATYYRTLCAPPDGAAPTDPAAGPESGPHRTA